MHSELGRFQVNFSNFRSKRVPILTLGKTYSRQVRSKVVFVRPVSPKCIKKIYMTICKMLLLFFVIAQKVIHHHGLTASGLVLHTLLSFQTLHISLKKKVLSSSKWCKDKSGCFFCCCLFCVVFICATILFRLQMYSCWRTRAKWNSRLNSVTLFQVGGEVYLSVILDAKPTITWWSCLY